MYSTYLTLYLLYNVTGHITHTIMQLIFAQLLIAVFAYADIHVRPLEPNPGIYYESQGNLRLLRSTLIDMTIDNLLKRDPYL